MSALYAGDFQSCASNLQSLVATLAMCVDLGEDMQHGLNARDQAVFDEQLAALPQVGWGRGLSDHTCNEATCVQRCAVSKRSVLLCSTRAESSVWGVPGARHKVHSVLPSCFVACRRSKATWRVRGQQLQQPSQTGPWQQRRSRWRSCR